MTESTARARSRARSRWFGNTDGGDPEFALVLIDVEAINTIDFICI